MDSFFGGIMLIIIIIMLFVYLIVTYVMFIFVSKRFKHDTLMVMHKAIQTAILPYMDIINTGEEWVLSKKKTGNTENIFINSKDGIKLYGLYIFDKRNKKIMILAHGYRSTVNIDLYSSCKKYFEMGYNLLLINQRATGKSSGKYITFGIKESEDIICWCNYFNKRFKNYSIVLGGISMGATSVLMAARYITDDMNVKAIISDSPYVFPYDEVLYCIKHYFHLDGRLFINLINVWCMLFGKFSLKEKSVIISLKNKEIPILLIHGENDDFVPINNSKIIYDNYLWKKEFVSFPNASHGMSYLVDSERYLTVINKFLSENV